ncbi:MAG: HD domain-containing phosphohydrolase [Clostridia bacterium]
MNTRRMVSIYELLQCLTDAADLISPDLTNHHQQVSYLAYLIADQMGLSNTSKRNLVIAGLLHDVGALGLKERHSFIEKEPPNIQDHAHRGWMLLSGLNHLKDAAHIIKYHHVPWDNGKGKVFNNEEVSMLSHIIHLADRIAVKIKNDNEVLEQVPDIRKQILSKKGKNFVPEMVDAFIEISHKEYIWLDLSYKPLLNILSKVVIFDIWELNWDDIIDLTKIFSKIIDFRSHFTATHTAGVAAVAVELARRSGFSELELKMMKVAGHLHDLGKLAVPTEILDKTKPLKVEEYNIIKSHAFYTFRLLQNIEAFDTVSRWAAFHHEKLNGTGYPFHLDRHQLSLGSRIIAVADIFTAIAEDRPYRSGMSERAIRDVLSDLVKNETICPYVTNILFDNIDEINHVRNSEQRKAAEEYRSFFEYS